jgi:hypothetical protein
MKKSEIKVLPEYYDTYINKVEDIELKEALNNFGPNLLEVEKGNLISIGDKVYAPGKWTIKEIMQHLIDSERVFNYRALCFARNDKTELPGYEENDYAVESNANVRSIEDLLNEFTNLRKSTIDLFSSFDEAMLMKEGFCFSKNVSVLALGFIMAGHTQHHFNVMKEKYFNLNS